MTIVSHTHRFIFLKGRKIAGSSIEIWLARCLEPSRNIIATSPKLKKMNPEIAAQLSPRLPFLHAGLRGRRGRIVEHMHARDLRDVLGSRVWQNYRKITVIRSPWDRLVSLWRHRQTRRERRGLPLISLDDFVRAIESGSDAEMDRCGAKNWCNSPFYSIDGNIVADDLVRYENLESDLESVFSPLGILLDDLPRARAGSRKAEDAVENLPEDLVRRIGDLFATEIDMFGYEWPKPIEKGINPERARGKEVRASWDGNSCP